MSTTNNNNRKYRTGNLDHWVLCLLWNSICFPIHLHIWEDSPWWLSHQKLGTFALLFFHIDDYSNTFEVFLLISSEPIGNNELFHFILGSQTQLTQDRMLNCVAQNSQNSFFCVCFLKFFFNSVVFLYGN